jgi:hypothetical protein
MISIRGDFPPPHGIFFPLIIGDYYGEFDSIFRPVDHIGCDIEKVRYIFEIK